VSFNSNDASQELMTEKFINQNILTDPFAIFSLHRLHEVRADGAISIVHLSGAAAVELVAAEALPM
jgi:hypothetical protein